MVIFDVWEMYMRSLVHENDMAKNEDLTDGGVEAYITFVVQILVKVYLGLNGGGEERKCI